MGRSSPIVVKNRVYLTAVEGEALATLAFDVETGKLAWRRDIARARTHKIYVGNDSATPTPVTDGESLYVFFPDLGLVSFDLDGKERWRLPLGPFDSFYGLSSSPVVHGDTVALVCDQRSGSFAIGVDKSTGRIRWRVERHARADGGLLDPGHLRAGRREAAARRHRRAPQRRLRPGDGREPVVDRQAGDLSGRLTGPARQPGDRRRDGRGRARVPDVRLVPREAGREQGRGPDARGIRQGRGVQGSLRLDRRGQRRPHRPGGMERETGGERRRARHHRQPHRRRGRPDGVEPAVARQEVLLLPDHAARLPRRPVPRQERRRRDDARPPARARSSRPAAPRRRSTSTSRPRWPATGRCTSSARRGRSRC